MGSSDILLLIVLLLMAAFGIGIAMFFLQRYLNPEPSPVEDRLARIKAVQAAVEVDPMAARMAKLYTAEYSNENIGKLLAKYSFVAGLRKLIHQSGLKMPVDKFVVMFWAIPIIACFVLGITMGSLIIMLCGGVVAYCSTLFLKFKRGQRFAKIVSQLPDALNLITSSLRAGHAFQSALAVVSTEMPDPIAGEFAALVRDINLGIPIKEALDKLVSNLDTLSDVRMFVTAVQIQREAGGNLAEILDKLSYTIRERFKLKGQIAALTGQARLTGYVLGAAPIVLLVGLTIFMPSYLDKLYNTEMGRGMLLFGGISQLIGFFIMRKIIDIRI